MKQPEALRLADALEVMYRPRWCNHVEMESAAELRRLHEVNQELLATMEKLACLGNGNAHGNSIGNDIAIAAIAKAGGAA